MRYAIPALLSLLGAVPAAGQHGLAYQPYAAHYHAGRYFPAGNYATYGGNYYLQGHGVCYGYSCEATYKNQFAATVVIQKEYVSPGYSLTPYQQAPVAEKDDLAKSLLLQSQQRDAAAAAEAAAERRQNTAFQQQQNLLLLQALLLRQGGPSPGVDFGPVPGIPPVPQFQPIPPAAPGSAPRLAPKKPTLEAFVDAHCIVCHGSNGAKGNLDLSDLSKLSAERWADCWDAICDDTMPPKVKVPAVEKTAVKGEFRQRIFARK